MLEKQLKRREEQDFDEVQINYDEECSDDSDNDETYSENEGVERKRMKYDIDQMFEIIHKRDYKKWSLSHIHHDYRQISSDAYGRTQISRYAKNQFTICT